MSIFRPRNIFVKYFAYSIINSRTIALTTVKMEKALDNLQSNPFYDKYSARISELQKTCPEKFKTLAQQQTKEEKSAKLAPVDTR